MRKETEDETQFITKIAGSSEPSRERVLGGGFEL
jgi:hypothetical protein